MIHALHKGTDLITPVKPNTIAKSIAIGNPADGFYVLKAVRESGGWGDVATDPEIIDAIKLLARTEGIFAEPAGGTTLAVTMKLIAQGRIKRRRERGGSDHRQRLQNARGGRRSRSSSRS